jgi:hypothetical protein
MKRLLLSTLVKYSFVECGNVGIRFGDVHIPTLRSFDLSQRHIVVDDPLGGLRQPSIRVAGRRSIHRRASCDAEGTWRHLSDDSHERSRRRPRSRPRLLAPASRFRIATALRPRRLWPSHDEIRPITPQRIEDPRESTRECHDRHIAPAPRGQGMRPRPQLGTGALLAPPQSPTGLDHQRA